MKTLFIAVMALLSACGARNSEPPHRADWVIRSKLEFVSQDLQSQAPAIARDKFRLWFPYIAGDLHGAPTTGDLHNPALQPDNTFQIDLNRSHADLLKSLEKTSFSVSWLKIDPAEARIARLSPLVMEADGIEQVATADWIDADTKQRLMLVYIDRPASITGSFTNAETSLRYDVRTAEAGYVWIGNSEGAYKVVSRPREVILAATPLAR